MSTISEMGTRQGLNKGKQGGGTKGARGQHQQRQSLVLRHKTQTNIEQRQDRQYCQGRNLT